MNLSRLGEIAWDRREDYWVMLEATEEQRMFKDIGFFRLLINMRRKLKDVEDETLIAIKVLIDRLFRCISCAKENMNLIFCCARYETEQEVLDNLMNMINFGIQPDMVLPGDQEEEGFINLGANMRTGIHVMRIIVLVIAKMIIEDFEKLDKDTKTMLYLDLCKYIELWVKEDLSLL